MQVTDKAVSTDDDLKEGQADETEPGVATTTPRFDVAKLETVLAALLENKVEAIKQERKQSSVGSSPKSIIHRLRITSTSTTSSARDVESGDKEKVLSIRRWQRMQPTDSCETRSSCCGHHSQEVSISSPESHKFHRPHKSNLKTSPLMSRQSSRETNPRSPPSFSRQESHESYPSFSRQDSRESYSCRYGFGRQDSKDSTARIIVRQESKESGQSSRLTKQDSKDSRGCDWDVCRCKICSSQQRLRTKSCSCGGRGDIRLHRSFDEDYISLKIEDGCCSDEEAERRARRKRRRKRRRRIHRQLALEAMRGAAVIPPKSSAEDRVKVLDNDELPPKARWTIVATACVLLFLCLLLVGVTLRMAPLIDDMVRMENEQLINSYNKDAAKLNLTLGRSTVQIIDVT